MIEEILRTANKGEWSELYVFFKIALERVVYSADENYNAKKDEKYEFLELYRKNHGKEFTYDISRDDKVIIYDENKQVVDEISKNDLNSKTFSIFQRIKSEKATFAVEEATELMESYRLNAIKAGATDKSDIDGLVRLASSVTSLRLGFSIKSNLGSAPTLVNPSRHTNFVYEVVGFDGDLESINTMSGRSKLRDMIQSIYESGGAFKYVGMQSETYYKNLRMQDTQFPVVVAAMLLQFFRGKGNTFDVLAKLASEDEQLDMSVEEIEYKTKSFLRASALGMVPATPWDTRITSKGGYIVVLETGELVCYSLYYDDDFRDYLFANTKLDTPSTSKGYDYGYLYTEGGRQYFKLNLQVRFKK